MGQFFEDLKKGYEEIIAYREGKKMNEWISVKQRLPESNVINDISNEHMQYLCYGCGNGWGFHLSEYDGVKFNCEKQYIDLEITHWMPLPDLPEVKNE